MEKLTIKDLNAHQPRWCEGCGDYGIIQAVKKLIIDLELDPASVVNMAGIGCSSRAPHYINTYGGNTIHGRAIPIATGLKLARPDLDLIIHSGDGDAASIGGNHLLHGINKNVNCVFIMYDNGLYSLTKSQTSPTTPRGHKTNTSPGGALLDPLNMIKLAIGMGGSFVASTADFMPGHMLETLKKAHEHKGFSFVHVWQRCPHFFPEFADHTNLEFFSFLTHQNGLSVPDRYKEKTQIIEHDPSNLAEAFKYANDEKPFLGLFYQDRNKIRYDEKLQELVDVAPASDVEKIIGAFGI